MDKKFIIAFVVIFLLGLGGYFLLSNRTAPNTGTDSISQVSPSEQVGSGQNSLKNLFSSGVSQTCTFSSNSESYSGDGTVYVTKGKMRGDFSTVTGGQTVKSHMIVDGETSYIWQDGQEKGFKATFGEEAKTQAEAQTKSGVGVDENLDYKCKAGIVSNSNFDLPSGVEFVSLDEMMKAIPTGSSSQCSACDSLTGDSKTQCLTVLKCN